MTTPLADAEEFLNAVDLVLALIGTAAAADRWDDPSVVEGFMVGALVAHVYSTVRLFEVALERPEKPEKPNRGVGTLADFYGLNRVEDRSELDDDFHVAVRADAQRRAAEGPDALRRRFEDLVGRLRVSLSRQQDTRLISVWRIEGGATRLSDYLRTRVVELAVHADDVAQSVGTEVELPSEVASVVSGVPRAREGSFRGR